MLRRRPRTPRAALVALALLAALPSLAPAAPVVGFVESWPTAGVLGSWGGGSMNTNPGTDGLDGPTDGYLRVGTASVARLGVVAMGSDYAGDWQAAGVAAVRFHLRDVGTDDPLEIRFSIGSRFNFWQYNEGFTPPTEGWVECIVDLRSAANFTQIIGTGSFDAALQGADRVHIRHDLAPYMQEPDQIQADFGIDEFEMADASVPVVATTWGRIKRLYR